MENAIRSLLGLNSTVPAEPGQNLSQIGSPEMYFGTARLQYLNPGQQPFALPMFYTFPSKLDLNTFALSGAWQYNSDKIILTKPGGKIMLKFHSGKVFMVAQSSSLQKISITVDGKMQPDVTIAPPSFIRFLTRMTTATIL